MAEDPNVVRNGVFNKTYYTVTSLPAASAGNVGNIEWVTDANSNYSVDPNETVVGGGTTRARVKSDGSAWRLYGGQRD